VTERERIALLDFCTQKFQAEHCFVGKKSRHRIWSAIGFNGFIYDQSRIDEWIATITAQRSDGPVFTLRRWIDITDATSSAEVMSKLEECLKDFDDFLGCGCGKSDTCQRHPMMEQGQTLD
jgi:hypothetical protein